MKAVAKKLQLRIVGVKKEKLLNKILDKIEEKMDVEGWVEAHHGGGHLRAAVAVPPWDHPSG